MECFDPQTNVGYPSHEEWVAGNDTGRGGDPLGICTRCHEIVDLGCCRAMARQGNERCRRALKAAGLDVVR